MKIRPCRMKDKIYEANNSNKERNFHVNNSVYVLQFGQCFNQHNNIPVSNKKNESETLNTASNLRNSIEPKFNLPFTLHNITNLIQYTYQWQGFSKCSHRTAKTRRVSRIP